MVKDQIGPQRPPLFTKPLLVVKHKLDVSIYDFPRTTSQKPVYLIGSNFVEQTFNHANFHHLTKISLLLPNVKFCLIRVKVSLGEVKVTLKREPLL